MNKSWFFNSKFKDFCKEKGLEPHITIDERLVLVCPKLPEKPLQEEIAKSLKELVPAEVEWGLSEGLSAQTEKTLSSYLAGYGVRGCGMVYGPAGEIALFFPEVPDTTAMQPESPVWQEVGNLLMRDPYVKGYHIIVRGEMYRNSDGYVKPDDSGSEVDKAIPGSSVKGFKAPVIKDNRFNYDREFLPKDVGTDVKILLESCNSVDEFLKNI
jgi:hypothetical protein